jgi:hypothetical protein
LIDFDFNLLSRLATLEIANTTIFFKIEKYQRS